MFRKVMCFAFAAMFLVMGSAAFGASALDSDVLIVGTESTFRPFEFRSADNEIVGFDMDLARMIGDKLGKEVKIIDMAFDALIPSILTKKIHIVAAGMSNTPERAKKVAFSDSYYSTPDSFIVKSENDKIQGIEDLAGKTCSVQLGTIQDGFVSGLKDLEIKRFSKTDDALREVLLGRVDFAVVDSTVASENLKSNKDFAGKLKIAFNHKIGSSAMALAMNKEDTRFVEAVNNALRELKEDGSLEMVEKKWFSE